MSDRWFGDVPIDDAGHYIDYEKRCYVELAKHGARIDEIKKWNLSLKQLSSLTHGLKQLALRHDMRQKQPGLTYVEPHDHLLSVFPDDATKLRSAFHFLQEGFDRGEAVMMITDEMTKDEILDRIGREWYVDGRELERRGDITVKSVREWYFPDGVLRTDRIVANWMAITNLVASKGRPGLRVFGDASAFFKNGFSKELVEYESALDAKFVGIPLTALCGYTDEDIERLSIPQIEQLQKHHKVVC